MNMNHLNIFPEDTCLITQLCEHLKLKFDPIQLHTVTIVFPTERMGTVLLANLAQKFPAFLTPQIKTIDRFVIDQMQNNFDIPDIISPLFAEFILANIIKQESYKYIKLGDEHELYQFFHDIQEISLDEQAFLQLRQINEEDFFRTVATTSILEERFKEVEHLYQTFQNYLEKNNMQTSNKAMRNVCDHFIEYINQQQITFSHPTFFVGFTTVKSFYKTLLAKLLQLENIFLWVTTPPDLYNQVNPLRQLIQSVSNIYPQTLQTQTQAQCKVKITECKDITSEITFVIRESQNLINNGCAPSQIAILLTNEPIQGKILRTLIEKSKIRANIAIPIAFRQTLPGSWLTALVAMIEAGYSVQEILDFALHPLTIHWLSKTEHHTAFDLKSSIIFGICRQNHTESLELIAKESINEICQQALLKIHTLIQSNLYKHIKNLKTEITVAHWINFLHNMANEFAIFDTEHQENFGLEASIKTCFETFSKQVQSYINLSNTTLHFFDFKKFIFEKLLSQDVRNVGYPLKGIQVLSLPEARYIPFTYVFIIGCTEGNFPKSLPNDHIIDEWYKLKIGLPGWQYVEALEDTTFNLLLSRLPHIHLTFAIQEFEQPTVRSRFIEKLLSLNVATLQHQPSEALSIKNHNLYDFTNKKKETFGIYTANRGKFHYSISATSLEHLITCPYKFLLYHLNIKPLELPQDQKIKKEGEWLHFILQIFFTGGVIEKNQIAPLKLPTSNIFEFCLQRLKDITERSAKNQDKHSPLYFHLMDYSWPKFAHFFAQLCITSPYQNSNDFKEFKFGKLSADRMAQMTINGHRYLLNGSIDSIDLFKDFFLLIDYKRKNITESQKVQSGQSPQLTFYLIALAQLGQFPFAEQIEKFLVGYWSITKGHWEAQLVGKDILDFAQQQDLCSKKTGSIDHSLQNLKNLWSEADQKLFIEQHPFLPIANKDDWCTYCEFKNLCRLNDLQIEKQP